MGKGAEKFFAIRPAQGNDRGLGFSSTPHRRPREPSRISDPKPALICLHRGPESQSLVRKGDSGAQSIITWAECSVSFPSPAWECQQARAAL